MLRAPFIYGCAVSDESWKLFYFNSMLVEIYLLVPKTTLIMVLGSKHESILFVHIYVPSVTPKINIPLLQLLEVS